MICQRIGHEEDSLHVPEMGTHLATEQGLSLRVPKSTASE
jgi:hypothetical protein